MDLFHGRVAVEGGVVETDLGHAPQDVGKERSASGAFALSHVGGGDERNVVRIDSGFEQRFAAFAAGLEGKLFPTP